VMNMLLLVPALFMLQVFDRVLGSRSIETLVMLLAIALVALLGMAWLDAVRSRLLTSVGVQFETELGPRVLQVEIERGASPRASQGTGGLRDLMTLRGFVAGPGFAGMLDSPWVIFYTGVIFLFDPLLGAVALAGAVVMLLLGILNHQVSAKAQQAMQQDSRRASLYADQGIANAEVSVALGMTPGIARHWGSLIERALGGLVRSNRSSSAISAAAKFTRQFLQVVMLAAGVWLVIDQRTTPGVMIAATILLARALAPVEVAVAQWRTFVEARASLRRLRELLAHTQDGGMAGTELPRPIGKLAVERVTFGFGSGGRPVLRQVSLSLEPGQALAVVGPSASGKSTLVRTLVGLWKPDSGVVRLDGADVSLWSRENLGAAIGYLPQSVELFAGTVAENIARMGAVQSEEVIAAARRANAHELILRLPQGYDTLIGNGGAFLSAGQRQRIALARALYRSPAFVVLDEPNSNLDGDGEAALIACLRTLKADGVTVVVVTHRTMLLGEMDRLLVLRDGAVERFGSPDAVMAGQKRATVRSPSTVAMPSVSAVAAASPMAETGTGA
jgi:PrtD family type I secretion system ABC transporter